MTGAEVTSLLEQGLDLNLCLPGTKAERFSHCISISYLRVRGTSQGPSHLTSTTASANGQPDSTEKKMGQVCFVHPAFLEREFQE
jgi:hypothetical protein